MNPIIIVLGIIVILLIYVLYAYFSKPGSLVKNSINLNSANAAIAADKIVNPTSTRYAYGVWVYVNSWAQKTKTIMYRGTNIQNPNKAEFALYLDPSTPTLKCTINDKQVIVTDNFPIQKWTCVVISVDNQIIDCYLDGKLVKSQKLPAIQPSNSSKLDLQFGSGVDIYLAGVNRWTVPMDPKTAWDTYLAGNGVSSSVNPYNLNLLLLKDNVEKSRYSLY